MRLEGKSAIVTRAAWSLDQSIVADLAREGAQVMRCDILKGQGAEPARATGSDAVFRTRDVTKADQWTDTAAAAEQLFGVIDILVDNAAMIEQVSFDHVTEYLIRPPRLDAHAADRGGAPRLGRQPSIVASHHGNERGHETCIFPGVR